MNVDQAYEQAIRPLSSREKLSIARRIISEIEAEAPAEEGEDLAAGLPDPPFTVRSRERLVQLLDEGMNSPVSEFTDDTVEQMRQEVRRRHAQRRP